MGKSYGAIGLGMCLLVGLVWMPKPCMDAAANGLMLCANVLIPSLFPFFICSKLLMKGGFAAFVSGRMQGIMRPLFNVPGCGAFAFVMGILSGYPVGAKCAAELYESGQCTKGEAERLTAFCNNSGPLFILGSVGAGLLGSPQAGVLLYLAHVLSALTVGLLFRFYKRTEPIEAVGRRSKQQRCESGAKLLAQSVTEAVELMLFVCGFVILFGVLLQMLQAAVLCHISNPTAVALCYGLFELINGVTKLCSLPSGPSLMLLSAVIAWGGVGVMLQVFGITSQHRFSKTSFVAAKAMQSVCAAGYTYLLLKLPVGRPTAAACMQRVLQPAELWCGSLLLLGIAVGSCVVFCLISSLVKSVI